MYLKELTDLPGVSGDEGQVRAFIADKMQNLCDELVTDSIGNLICLKKGTDENPKD